MYSTFYRKTGILMAYFLYIDETFEYIARSSQFVVFCQKLQTGGLASVLKVYPLNEPHDLIFEEHINNG